MSDTRERINRIRQVEAVLGAIERRMPFDEHSLALLDRAFGLLSELEHDAQLSERRVLRWAVRLLMWVHKNVRPYQLRASGPLTYIPLPSLSPSRGWHACVHRSNYRFRQTGLLCALPSVACR